MWRQVRRLGSGLWGERRGWRDTQRFQNNPGFEMLDPGPFLAWGWRARGGQSGQCRSANQPLGGGGWTAPGPEERGLEGTASGKAGAGASREAEGKGDTASASATARQKGGAGFLPLQDWEGREPSCASAPTQAVLTTFSPTDQYLAPLPHPTSKAQGWGRGSKGLGGGAVSGNSHTQGRVGGEVLGRWAGSHPSPPRVQSALRPSPHLRGSGQCLRGGGGGGGRSADQSGVRVEAGALHPAEAVPGSGSRAPDQAPAPRSP